MNVTLFLSHILGEVASYCKPSHPHPLLFSVEFENRKDTWGYMFEPGFPEIMFRVVSIGPTCWVRLEVGRILTNPQVLLRITYCTKKCLLLLDVMSFYPVCMYIAIKKHRQDGWILGQRSTTNRTSRLWAYLFVFVSLAGGNHRALQGFGIGLSGVNDPRN
jgi:hypothetical protein